MHETVIASSLLSMVESEVAKHVEAAGVSVSWSVSEIRLSIGLLTAIEPRTLQGCFSLLAEGTVAEGAALLIDVRPLQGHCPGCGRDVELATRRSFACPHCHAMRVDWQGGNELLITSLRVRDNAHSAIL